MKTAEMSRVRQGLTSRIREPEVTTRTTMGEIAASMDDVIAMGPGDPDLPTPQHIIDAAKAALDSGATHYTPPPGDIRLRTAVASRIKQAQHTEYDPATEIIITTGAEEAIYLALVSIIETDDEFTRARIPIYDLRLGR